jgi:hypothetical protein
LAAGIRGHWSKWAEAALTLLLIPVIGMQRAARRAARGATAVSDALARIAA